MTIAVELAAVLSDRFTLDLAFEIPSTGVTALLGPSGSGKTCVLRALAGLDKHAGTIRFGDEIWQDDKHFVPTHLRRIGYVFQGVGLLPHLNVARNLDFAIARASAGRFGRDDVIARTGIASLLDRIPARLSGGEVQRASIARALVSQPRMLLMDEPLSGLDGEARDALLGGLENVLQDIPIPTVYVTHDVAESQRLATHVIRLRNGQIAR